MFSGCYQRMIMIFPASAGKLDTAKSVTEKCDTNVTSSIYMAIPMSNAMFGNADGSRQRIRLCFTLHNASQGIIYCWPMAMKIQATEDAAQRHAVLHEDTMNVTKFDSRSAVPVIQHGYSIEYQCERECEFLTKQGMMYASALEWSDKKEVVGDMIPGTVAGYLSYTVDIEIENVEMDFPNIVLGLEAVKAYHEREIVVLSDLSVFTY